MRQAIFRLAVTGALLGLVWLSVDRQALWIRLAAFDPAWFALAVTLVVPQVALSAERWRFTAARLAHPLPFGVAVREYWIASALNQVLPGGVAGDALRALRHARSDMSPPGGIGTAVRAVMIERASGQLVLGAVVAAGILAWPFVLDGATGASSWLAIAVVVASVAIVAGAAAAFTRRGRGRIARFLRALGRDALAAFGDGRAWLVQISLSVLVLGLYIGCFAAAARSAGVTMGAAEIVLIVPAVLLAMVVPVTIAGWGVREAAAAGLFALAGLTAAEGVAASVAYGIAVLTGSLPGLAFIAARR